ncbi:MAG: thiamine phosphate synthase [Bryobacter sp.]
MLYPILDTALLRKHNIDLVEAIALSLSYPLPFVQIRHKADFDRDFVAQLDRIAQTAEPSRIILNDRADYSRLFGFGLHVGQEDLPAPEARSIVGPQATLGLSTHNDSQMRSAPFAELTYLALGPIFSTNSKANPDPVVGTDQLRAWRPLCPLPLVAIGGITRENAAEVKAAGADYFALLSALWPPPYTLRSFGHEIETWLKLYPPPALPPSKKA